MSWTEERIAKLTQMWESGSTASQIADELGGVSRNAVIGKAHRLGLKSRPSPVKANEAKSAKAKEAAAAQPSRKAEPAPKPKAPLAAKPASSAEEPRPAAPRAEAETGIRPAPAPNQPLPGRGGDPIPRIHSVGPGGFVRQGPGEQQAPIPPAPPRRRVPAKPSPEVADKTHLLDLSDRVCRWPMGHPGEPDFHFCGEKVNPGYPYCVEHCGRAYQAQLPRGARRPPPPLPFGGPRVR